MAGALRRGRTGDVMTNFWDFSVWGTLNLFAALLLALLAANALKKNIRFLQASLIPTSVLAGLILLLISLVYKPGSEEPLFNSGFFGGNGVAQLEIITYHALALGFISSTFRTTHTSFGKQRTAEIFNTGVTTVSTYLMQGILGMCITMGAAATFMKDLLPAAGVLLPFGYGQGTGQALNYGNIYENDWGFYGGRSFGLTIAAFGFLSASIGGVIFLNVMKKKGRFGPSEEMAEILSSADIQHPDEIPMNGAMDKMTVQVAFVAAAYLLDYLIMLGLGSLLPGMRSVVYGFNFLFGVIAAILIKQIMNLLQRKAVVKKRYTNNFIMTRISNLCFDIMVVAGIAAIRIEVLKGYWGILLALGLVGLVSTFLYNRFVAKKLFPEYETEQFLVMYGMLTGTASTGIMLLREVDGKFETPAADNLVYQNIPAMIFGFPMMLLATLAPKQPVLTLGILVVFFFFMNVILFRKQLFSKKK